MEIVTKGSYYTEKLTFTTSQLFAKAVHNDE